MRQQIQSGDFVYGSKPIIEVTDVVDAYIHVPFCMSTCAFCPYYKTLYKQVKKTAFIQALLLEIVSAQPMVAIEHLVIGGGTPNLLSVMELKKIIDALNLKAPIEHIHMEVLPSLLSEDYIRGLKNIGVETLIFGLEGFGAELLVSSGRMVQTLPHLIKMLRTATEVGLRSKVNFLVGQEDQRETSFIEDVHVISEIRPHEIRLRPVIKTEGEPDERMFELIELAAEILLEKGYYRVGLWEFALEPMPPKTIKTLVGFGPSAYTLHERFQLINPELDLYIHEQLYGHGRMIINELDEISMQWQRFVSRLFHLDMASLEPEFAYGKWYKRWLQLSGCIKGGALTEKGFLEAHALVYARMASFPRPIQKPELLLNGAYYTAECSFAENYAMQYETARRQNSGVEMD